MTSDILVRTPARRYATALLDASLKQKNFSTVLWELETFLDQMKQVPLANEVFSNPAIPLEKKEKILEDIGSKVRFQKLTMNFLKVLVGRQRTALLAEIILSVQEQFLERQDIVVVEVTTPKKLNEIQAKKLTSQLEAFTGKKIQMENRVDPTLIGGAITQIGTTVYDGSVQASLEQIKNKIIQS
jgi:F-type H+-transporting ATPase subunit delta